MPTALTEIDEEAEELRTLTPQMRAFVDLYYNLGPAKGNGKLAAELAGYKQAANSAYTLLRRRDVLSALSYLAKSKGLAAVVPAMEYLVGVVDGSEGAPHPVRLQAARDLIALSGINLIQERKVSIDITDNRTREQVLGQVEQRLLKMFGEKPKVLIDATFEEVTDEETE